MLLAAALADPAGSPTESPADAGVDAAPASEGLQEAKAEYRKGSEAYQTGRYEQAVRHFERSFELSHRSDLLYNLGQAYSRWFEISDDPEHLRRARRLFENYIDAVQERPDMDESRRDAERRVAEIDAQLERRQRSAPTTAPPSAPRDRPLYQKGWFWGTIVGVVVVAAAATTVGVLVARRRDERFEPELGTLGEFHASPGTGLSFRF